VFALGSFDVYFFWSYESQLHFRGAQFNHLDGDQISVDINPFPKLALDHESAPIHHYFWQGTLRDGFKPSTSKPSATDGALISELPEQGLSASNFFKISSTAFARLGQSLGRNCAVKGAPLVVSFL